MSPCFYPQASHSWWSSLRISSPQRRASSACGAAGRARGGSATSPTRGLWSTHCAWWVVAWRACGAGQQGAGARSRPQTPVSRLFPSGLPAARLCVRPHALGKLCAQSSCVADGPHLRWPKSRIEAGAIRTSEAAMKKARECGARRALYTWGCTPRSPGLFLANLRLLLSSTHSQALQ